MALHRKLSGADVHTPYRWVVAGAAARAAIAVNPDGSTITEDNGLRAKLLQTDTNTEYVCTAISPVTFTAVSGSTELSAADIKIAYESNSDTNAYTDTEKTKLAGIEANATADQTGAEIVSAIDTELDSTDWKTGGSTTSPSYVLVTENYTVTTATRFSVDVSSTSTSTLTVTLPASPSDGDSLDCVNEGGDYSTCNLIIGRNSKKIGGLEEDLVVDEEWGQFSLIFQSDSWSVYQPETVGSSGTVIDNLTSTSATDALSANQGRELKALVDAGGGSGGSSLPTFVASGSIPSAGLSVVLNNDETVSVVTQSGTSDGAGSEVIFNSEATNAISSTFDSANGKIIIAYRDDSNSNYGTAIVGTVSGTSITFGTPVVFNSGSSYYTSSTYDSTNGKVVIAYRDDSNSDYGTAIVGAVSGTSITFGTPTVFNSGSSSYISSTFDSASGKVVIAYQDHASSDYGTAIVGTVSGNSISFGSPVVFNSGATRYISSTYDSANDKVVIAYQDYDNSSYGKAIIGTVSGTSISFGTPVIFNDGNAIYISATFDSTNGKILIAYQDYDNSSYGTAIVCTVSGTSITFGAEVVFNSGLTRYISATFDSANSKIIIAYRDYGNSSYGTAIVGIISGTSITFDTPVVFNSGASSRTSATFDSASGKILIAYQDYDNSSYGTSVVFTVGGIQSTAKNFIGYSQNSAVDTEDVQVAMKYAVDENQTGLTSDTDYWVDSDGTLATSDTGYAKAGVGVTATKLMVGV